MRKAAAVLAFLALTACSKPHPPQGKWEGGYSNNGTLVAARVEITADGLIKVSAPDITDMQTARPERLQEIFIGLQPVFWSDAHVDSQDSIDERPFGSLLARGQSTGCPWAVAPASARSSSASLRFASARSSCGRDTLY